MPVLAPRPVPSHVHQSGTDGKFRGKWANAETTTHVIPEKFQSPSCPENLQVDLFIHNSFEFYNTYKSKDGTIEWHGRQCKVKNCACLVRLRKISADTVEKQSLSTCKHPVPILGDRGLPAKYQAFICLTLADLRSGGIPLQRVNAETQVWKPLMSYFHSVGDVVFNNEALVADLKTRVKNRILNKKKEKRKDVRDGAKSYPARNWKEQDYTRFKTEHFLPQLKKPLPLPKTIDDLNAQAKMIHLGDTPTSAGYQINDKMDPACRLVVLRDPPADHPFMERVKAMDPNGVETKKIICFSTFRMLFNCTECEHLFWDVVVSGDATYYRDADGKSIICYFIGTWDLQERRRPGGKEVTLSMRPFAGYIGLGESELAVAYLIACLRYTLATTWLMHMDPKKGCCSDLSRAAVNAFMVFRRPITMGFEHVFFHFLPTAPKRKPGTGGYLKHIIRPEKKRKFLVDVCQRDVKLFCYRCKSHPMHHVVTKCITEEGWEDRYGEGVICKKMQKSYLIKKQQAGWFYTVLGRPGLYPTQNPIENLNKGSLGVDVLSGQTFGSFVLNEVPALLKTFSLERVGVKCTSPMRSQDCITPADVERIIADGYTKDDVRKVNGRTYVNARPDYVGVALSDKRIAEYQQILGGHFRPKYSQIEAVLSVTDSICEVKDYYMPDGSKVRMGDCVYSYQNMKCIHAMVSEYWDHVSMLVEQKKADDKRVGRRYKKSNAYASDPADVSYPSISALAEDDPYCPSNTMPSPQADRGRDGVKSHRNLPPEVQGFEYIEYSANELKYRYDKESTDDDD